MKKLLFLLTCQIIVWTFLSTAHANVLDYLEYNKIVPQAISSPNGSLEIYIQKKANWELVQKLDFDNFLREKTCDLSAFTEPGKTVSIKLVQKGGNAVHIDAVLMGDTPPTGKGLTEHEMQKISKKDFDVLDAYNKIFQLDFSEKRESQTLRLVARIEGDRISQTPFIFPMVNIFKEMSPNSRFYTYDTSTKKPENVSDSEPFFREYCIPGTGHPLGYAYGWVWDDPEYLYVYLDITGDNTRDGNKDYATVHVRTGNGIKSFRISEDQTQYGLSSFQYTDKVPYEHKTYQFKIPKNKTGEEKESYNLAFSVYGTMAPVASQMCDIPYNIKGANWWTGLRIRPLANTVFTIDFFGPKSDMPYETITKSITSVDGWTGNVDQLLPDPDDFQTPTFMRIYADYRFTVTQFLGKTGGDGFSHQTFYSYPYSVGWPYEDDGGGILIK